MFEIIKGLHIELGIEQILKGQGIDPAKASAAITKIAADTLEEANSLLRPAALYGNVPVTGFQDDQLTFEGGAFKGPMVSRAFADANSLILALCTIGPELEQRVEELMSTDMMRAIALDGAGTAAVGEVTRITRERAAGSPQCAGLKIGMKANPGQEGWPIEQQRVFFSLVPAAEIGVRLTENCLMLPRKSVSFAVGCGERICGENVSCDFCSKRERCRWRSEGKSK